MRGVELLTCGVLMVFVGGSGEQGRFGWLVDESGTVSVWRRGCGVVAGRRLVGEGALSVQR